MTGADLCWPGVDQQRAVAACWHLTRALQRRLLSDRLPDRPWQISRQATLQSSSEHLRIARGFLGAVGFERKAGLWR